MKKRNATSPTLDVMQGLWAFAHALEARSKRMHRDIGVTGPQRLVLMVIAEAPGASPGEVARHLRLNPGTVSRLVTALERAKLVRRGEHSLDGRKQRLVLTPRGETLAAQPRGTIEGAVRAALASAAHGEARQARRFLERLTEALAVPETGPRRRAARG